MNIVLFAEHFGATYTNYNPHPILPGIYRLATHLRFSSHNVKTLAIWRITLGEFKRVIENLKSSEIDLVGISTTLLYNLPLSKDDVTDFVDKIKIIKSNLPKTKIIVGGSLVCSIYFENIHESYSLVDYFIKGQGESAFDAIIDNIEQDKKLFTESLIPKVVSDDIYKFDHFNSCTIEYTSNDYVNSEDSLGIEYSRGCIFKCSFCNYPGIGKKPGEYIKTKSVLRDELVKNYEMYGTKYYYFTDDLLNESVEKMEELAEISTSLPFEFKYSAYIRLDLIHKWPKMAELLKQSGLLVGHAGIETINDNSGKSVLKGLGKSRINETLEICNQSWANEVGLAGSFMLGLPHDTIDTVHELVEWLNYPIPKSILTDFNISALKLASEGMSNNPKYKYVWQDNKITGWTNQYSYSHDQASNDAAYALKKFYEKYTIPVRFSGFDLPQLLAYAEPRNYKDSMLKFYFTREKIQYISSSEDWYKLRRGWFYNRRLQYLKNIL